MTTEMIDDVKGVDVDEQGTKSQSEIEMRIAPNLNGVNAGGEEIDIEKYRLSQEFENIGIEKPILVVPVRRPNRQEWFQVHAEEAWRMPVALIELKEDRETYLVDPRVYSDLVAECVPKYIFACQSRQRVTFIWAVKMPGSDGRLDQWSGSALQIATEYCGRWIRVVANMSLGAYEVQFTRAAFDPPVWPTEGFQSLLSKAFRGKIIHSVDHPVIKKLRGEI